MFSKDIKSRNIDSTKTYGSIFVTVNGSKFLVCRKFLIELFQLPGKRLRIIQQKVKFNSKFTENRGKHNRPKKISDDDWQLVRDHWASIPNVETHYRCNDTSRLYFTDPFLDVKSLFETFREFYKGKNNTYQDMKYSSYYKFFKDMSPYSFRRPRTDNAICVKN